MSKKKSKTKSIKRPRGGVNPPKAESFPEFEPIVPKVDKQKALQEWFKSAKDATLDNSDEDAVNSAIIDPKQAVYAKKRRKD